ncbi:MAG: ABC transporter permease, partial [Bacteroidetes bacterium]|nr:ABC transporter permease [Bacteroidota bacterium]
AIFGKVYFPRIIMPLSKVISNLLKFCIQVFLFVCFYIYFIAKGKMTFDVNANILLLPVLLVIMISLGMGLGMIISSFTNKYKDLTFLVGFSVQLLMYASPVIYSLETVKAKNPQYYNYIAYNPISPVIETFRKSVLGGTVNYGMLIYSLCFSALVLIIGMIVFGRTEKSFIDTV